MTAQQQAAHEYCRSQGVKLRYAEYTTSSRRVMAKDTRSETLSKARKMGKR